MQKTQFIFIIFLFICNMPRAETTDCNCQPCKTRPSAPFVSLVLGGDARTFEQKRRMINGVQWETTSSFSLKCESGCLYTNLQDNSKMCFCDQGPIPLKNCPALPKPHRCDNCDIDTAPQVRNGEIKNCFEHADSTRCLYCCQEGMFYWKKNPKDCLMFICPKPNMWIPNRGKGPNCKNPDCCKKCCDGWEIIDVKFHVERAKLSKPVLIVAFQQEFDVQGNEAQIESVKTKCGLPYEKKIVTSFTNEGGVEIKVGTEFSAGIPRISEGKISTEGTITSKFTTGSVKEETIKLITECEIDHDKDGPVVCITTTHMQVNAEIPYTMTLKKGDCKCTAFGKFKTTNLFESKTTIVFAACKKKEKK